MTIIEAYIRNAPQEKQQLLTELYQLIKATVPEASEKISYGMPTFYLNGNLVHFAAAKQHLGFYPAPSAIRQFSTELTAYRTSKGAVQFPYDQKLPTDLIQQMVLFRVQENLAK
ncbi:iron chaperone [Isobaculum melis]|uniref:Uncharacterized conserved protein YdhG, YjbR/CyaY-like superfamily, DUF1801 family n=1 Tax=Isobaculum melis TaxID=142588 RepID=A0A1H9QGF1_9LACT|nr:DUF1801 domain-containing protein [Isobaculum melis]SER59554.1 Uncharacterized conserved protein YdhG, YjbR/CyaY-like superfamily, DUF1801 family [Isobaculum melis]